MASEWVTILVDGQGMRAPVSEPDASRTFPGIRVVMAAFGANTPPQGMAGLPSRQDFGGGIIAPSALQPFTQLYRRRCRAIRAGDEPPAGRTPSRVWRACTPWRRGISADSTGTRRSTTCGRSQGHSRNAVRWAIARSPRTPSMASTVTGARATTPRPQATSEGEGSGSFGNT
jgi:hypothetical protein